MFELENVLYKDILKIENLNIPKDKINCIIGESGSGKTTLLRMLNKLISPTSGDIFYNGRNLKSLDSVKLRRDVVMLPQNPIIFEGDILTNLTMGLRFSEKKIPSKETLIEILEKVKLNKSLEDSTKELSGGEKQRIALGRVMLMNPKVLLLDEPSSALDDDTEEFILNKITTHCAENNISLIMVTHSKKAAENFGENIIKINNGKIL